VRSSQHFFFQLPFFFTASARLCIIFTASWTPLDARINGQINHWH